jgi:serine/threonine/tyrosine-interacting protein
MTLYPWAAAFLYTAMARMSLICGQPTFDPGYFTGGISLSPAFVVMFVMQHYQLSWEDALHMVQNRRYCISPNGGFLTQLKVRHAANQPLRATSCLPC